MARVWLPKLLERVTPAGSLIFAVRPECRHLTGIDLPVSALELQRPCAPVLRLLQRWLQLPPSAIPGQRERARIARLVPPATARAIELALETDFEIPGYQVNSACLQWHLLPEGEAPQIIGSQASDDAFFRALYRNVAAVLVTGTLPPFARAGGRIDVTVSTIGDADTPPAGGLNAGVPATWPYPLPEMTWGNGSASYGGRNPIWNDLLKCPSIPLRLSSLWSLPLWHW